jgi:hypothetical protein
MSTRTWQDNAAEFAALDKGEGWPFARLVACSVTKGAGQHERGSRQNDRYDEKVSASKFAEIADTSAPRVLRYLEAWDKCAADGHCPRSSDLTPNDAHQIADPEIPFEVIYDASKAGSRPRDSRPGAAAQIINKRGAAAVLEELDEDGLLDLAEALTAKPEHRLLVHQAMDKHYPAVEKHQTSKAEAPREISVAIIAMKKAGRQLTELLATHAHELNSDERDAVLGQIAWLLNACGLWQSCLSSGSMDDELLAMLEEGSHD